MFFIINIFHFVFFFFSSWFLLLLFSMSIIIHILKSSYFSLSALLLCFVISYTRCFFYKNNKIQSKPYPMFLIFFGMLLICLFSIMSSFKNTINDNKVINEVWYLFLISFLNQFSSDNISLLISKTKIFWLKLSRIESTKYHLDSIIEISWISDTIKFKRKSNLK